MTLPRLFLLVSFLLFGGIGVAAVIKKKGKTTKETVIAAKKAPIEVKLQAELEKKESIPPLIMEKVKEAPQAPSIETELPVANRIDELFNKTEPRLPIVETVSYRSRVAWMKGRPAWLSDYASHYSTSRHFIARSLNGKPDYFKQEVAEGDKFNVFRLDKNISFHLLIDINRCKMWFYYIDNDKNERVLLKRYDVGLGRQDTSKTSGLLTPLGKYSLGNKIAIYKPKAMGMHNGQRIEMIRVFGTRWIPFEKELGGCTSPAKGYGIHGVPWISGSKGELAEDISCLGKYTSDGCVRLSTNDMEEIFAIIITKPTTIELVKDFNDAKLPGTEQKK